MFNQRKSLVRSSLACAVLTLAFVSAAAAADGILLPPPPVGPGGEDSITTSQGVRCSQSINSNGGYVDLGVAGGNLDSYVLPGTTSTQSAIGYARIIIPLGSAPKRMDCNKLYEMEIERLRAEIELMKIGVQ